MVLESGHMFSLFTRADLSLIQVEATFILTDLELMHRMVHVLRFKVDEACVLFNAHFHLQVRIDRIDKNKIVLFVLSKKAHFACEPKIIFLLPLLKKEALEQAIYSLTEIGANIIQLVTTEKSRRDFQGPREIDRLQSIMIAAAEQSKNYAIPQLMLPKSLKEALKIDQGDTKIVFDVNGQPLVGFLQNKQFLIGSKLILVGPEAGLTYAELTYAKDVGFQSAALTQTTLRAVQAVALAAGFCRLK